MFPNCAHDYNYVNGNLRAYYLYTGKRAKWGEEVHDS